jgi:hypothetical protein
MSVFFSQGARCDPKPFKRRPAAWLLRPCRKHLQYRDKFQLYNDNYRCKIIHTYVRAQHMHYESLGSCADQVWRSRGAFGSRQAWSSRADRRRSGKHRPQRAQLPTGLAKGRIICAAIDSYRYLDEGLLVGDPA